MSVQGAGAVMRRLDEIAKQTQKRIGGALYAEGLGIQKVSMERTPVDTGALRASHVTQQPTGRGLETTVAIQVGGPAAPYAPFVHDNLEAKHPVGQAKFLESAVDEARPDLVNRMAKRLGIGK